jgi:CheY-like chemotaxis protein
MLPAPRAARQRGFRGAAHAGVTAPAATPGQAVALRIGRRGAPPMGATRLLLLVEDDPLVRTTLAEALADAGFAVLEAEDAESALGLVAARADLAVLFTDINLPGADGFALARAARRLRPRLPVVYASGRYREADPRRALPDAAFLAKPFSVSAAVRTLEGAIAGG